MQRIIDKGVCDKGFIFNPSNCECECDKSCNICEYLDYPNWKCRKKLVDSLVKECTEITNETKITNENENENENKDKCNSYVVYKVLFSIIFTINIRIGIYFAYHKYVNRNKYDLPY